MPPRGASKHPAPPNAHLTATLLYENTYEASGDTGGQGGGGDPDGGSALPAAADPAAQPPSDEGWVARAHESPGGDTVEAPAAPPEKKKTLGGQIFGDDGTLDENDDNDDDDDAEPVRAAPVRPAPLTRRASSRVKGVAAPEPADDMAGTKKGKHPPDEGESADAGAARTSGADVLADEALEASSAGSEVDEADAQDESVAAGIVLLAAGAAAVDEKDKSNQHKSGVWGTKSPTGYVLTKERVAKMDHKDGKAWEVEVWNVVEDPAGGKIETLGSSTLTMKQTFFGMVVMKMYQIRSLMFLEK